MKILPLVALTIVVLLWSQSFVAIRHALRFLDPYDLVVVRYAVALVPLVLTLAVWCRGEIRRMSRRDWLIIVLLGLIAVPGYNLCLNCGETRISAGLASMIIALNPAFTYLLAVALKWEKSSWVRLAGVPVALAGIALSVFGAAGTSPAPTASGGHSSAVVGALLVLAGSAMWAIYNVVGRSLSTRYSALTVSCLNTAVGTIPLVFWVRVSTLEAAGKLPLWGWIAVLFLALGCTYVAVFLYFYGLRELGAARASVSIYFLPPLAILGECIMLGEGLSVSLLFGMLILLAGVALTAMPERRTSVGGGALANCE